MQSCPCYTVDKAPILRNDVCGDRVCETKVRCERHLDAYVYLGSDAKITKIADGYIAKYKSSLYNCKLSNILKLLAFAVLLGENSLEYTTELSLSLVMPLICFIETSGLGQSQQEYESSVVNGLLMSIQEILTSYNTSTSTVTYEILSKDGIDAGIINDSGLNTRLEQLAVAMGCPVKPFPNIGPPGQQK